MNQQWKIFVLSYKTILDAGWHSQPMSVDLRQSYSVDIQRNLGVQDLEDCWQACTVQENDPKLFSLVLLVQKIAIQDGYNNLVAEKKFTLSDALQSLILILNLLLKHAACNIISVYV